MSNNNSSRSKKKKDLAETQYQLIETDSEVKSYIYQQVAELNPYVTADTVVMVIARDPRDLKIDPQETDEENIRHIKELSEYKHRIAIILQEDGASLEAEAYHDDIFEAIKLAKTGLLERLVELQNEVDKDLKSDDRYKVALKNNRQLH